MKHPRAGALTKLVQEAEKVKPVSAIEVRWDTIDGREVPVWRIIYGDEKRQESEPVRW